MLHERDTIRDEIFDEVFASTELSASLPKFQMPQSEQLARHAYRLVSDELILDGNSRQNLATFCQTWLEPEVRDLMRETLDKNMVDKDEYPQTAAIEARCVHILADLWNSPEAENTLGTSTTGSSEAAMLGGMALLWKWRERRRQLVCRRTNQTSSAGPFRCVGASSPATGTSSCAKSPWNMTG